MPLRYERSSQLASRVVDGLAFIVTAKDNRLLTLNSTATFIWEALSTPRTVDEVAASLSQRFEVNLESAQADVAECFSDLVERQILVAKEA